VKSVATRFGPNVRAGFIDAPEIGLPHSPASAIYAPTPIAPKIPMFWAPDAVPRMTLTRPRVSTARHLGRAQVCDRNRLENRFANRHGGLLLTAAKFFGLLEGVIYAPLFDESKLANHAD